jgi:peptidoglycan/LPS O-acetylase OafA/YrhL
MTPARSGEAPGSEVVQQAGEARSARIESLRALAALGVLVGHVFGQVHDYDPAQTLSTFWQRVLLGGGFGVFLFFALSGYLLFRPFAERDYGGGPRIDLRRYARNRALRILPLYYVVLVVVLVLGEGGGTPEQWVGFATFSENFTSDRTTITAVNGVMWSLVIEVHFYVLLPLIAYALSRLSRRSLVRVAVLLGTLAAISLAFRYLTLYRYERLERPLFDYTIISTFFYFVAGMLVAVVRVAWREGPPAWVRGPILRAEIWMAVSLVFWAVVFDDYAHGWAAAPASFFLLGACVLPLRAGPVVRALEWRWLALLGVASYSLYLWHLPILESLGQAGWAPTTFLGLLAVTLALSIPASVLSYRFIEVPFLRLRRRWSGRPVLPAEPTASATVATAAEAPARG